MSREHALLFREDGKFFISDLKSRFGTLIEDHRIVEGEIVRLDHGNRLKFGTLPENTFKFYLEGHG